MDKCFVLVINLFLYCWDEENLEQKAENCTKQKSEDEREKKKVTLCIGCFDVLPLIGGTIKTNCFASRINR